MQNKQAKMDVIVHLLLSSCINNTCISHLNMKFINKKEIIQVGKRQEIIYKKSKTNAVQSHIKDVNEYLVIPPQF